MFLNIFSAIVVPLFLFSAVASAAGFGAQVDLSSVGPSTPLSSKSTICNVLNYGGVADNKTDIGPAIKLAFSSCAVKGGATLYIPPGSYSLATGVVLNKASKFAFQIDGLITLTSNGAFSGNAFVIENGNDVEVFSSNGLGAINGQGWIARFTASGQNARLFRFISCINIAIHDLILVDSPTFHLIFNGVSNMEAYHITIRGPSIGGSDGIDVACTDNCYIHHVEVTNRDECVSVKSPSQNMLIEDVFCNKSGGMSIGSLTANGVTSTTMAQVSNITMRNINSYQCTQMLMIKTWPGGTGATGFVKNSLFENFWAYDSTYGLDIDQYWVSRTTPDTGAVQISTLTFNNWTGTVDNGISRAPIVIRGSDIVPLTDITLSGFSMWTVNQNKLLQQCKNVYGTGYCAATSKAGQSLTTFTTTMTETATPAGYTAPAKPSWAVSGYGVTIPIPVYTPAVLWSSAASSVAAAVAVADTSMSASSASSVATASSTIGSGLASTSSKPAPSTTSLKASSAPLSTIAVPSSTPLATKTVKTSTTTTVAPMSTVVTDVAAHYSQCGGMFFSGPTVCAGSYSCIFVNRWYSQCL